MTPPMTPPKITSYFWTRVDRYTQNAFLRRCESDQWLEPYIDATSVRMLATRLIQDHNLPAEDSTAAAMILMFDQLDDPSKNAILARIRPSKKDRRKLAGR